MPFLFCLSFANRVSDSGDLYIDFNRNHLTFPVAYLVCQDYALFILFTSGARTCIVYHISHIMPCVCGGCLLCCLFVSGLLLSSASVSFRSCEDLFDYVRLSSSWTCSSSLRDFRQDDHTLEITSIFAC